jgi:hypothetical protein
MTEDLWTGGQLDDLDQPARHRATRTADTARHIGCPLWWFPLVFPIVRGKGELAITGYV